VTVNDQGPRPQVSSADLQRMSAEDIAGAFFEGRLSDVLAGREPGELPPWPAGQVTEAELKGMGPEEIVEALQDGRLKALRGLPVEGFAGPPWASPEQVAVPARFG